MKNLLISCVYLMLATTFEAVGDATVRIGLFDKAGLSRGASLAGGAALLFGYGVMLNLAPLPFDRVVGLYIATLFVVWQLVSFVTFRSLPGVPILSGGSLIVLGGLVVTFWTSAQK